MVVIEDQEMRQSPEEARAPQSGN